MKKNDCFFNAETSINKPIILYYIADMKKQVPQINLTSIEEIKFAQQNLKFNLLDESNTS